ncbi:MAG: trehalase [Cyclobacteriaceae bacterium]|nr:trehalase [Cyclobacteriaceae bacterium]MCH8517171.1 trehalase [Cyclobacteriaceae bacterium]
MINDSRSIRPEQAFPKLYEQVQLSGIFDDSKTFADAKLIVSVEEVRKAYSEENPTTQPELLAFISGYFKWEESTPYIDAENRLENYDVDLYELLKYRWLDLTRVDEQEKYLSSKLPLPYSYIMPGGRFREIYYWDSYFTMVGLMKSGKDEDAIHMLNNFTSLIHSIGFIPNGNRTYYLGRSQPPYYLLMLQLMQESGYELNASHWDALLKEYKFWMAWNEDSTQATHLRRVQMDSSLFNRYYDNEAEPRPESYREDVELVHGYDKEKQEQAWLNLRAACESGWDFSSRWFGYESTLDDLITTDLLPIDLNCLIYAMEVELSQQLASKVYIQDDELLAFINKNKTKRTQFIQNSMWDQEEHFFFDYNHMLGKRSNVLNLATVYPLYFELASADQASSMVNRIMEVFLYPGGLVTTIDDSRQQWDFPNGWAPLQYMAVEGMIKYGFYQEAYEVMDRWTALNKKVFQKTGKMMEKYNVVDIELEAGGGEYALQDGFGWTNAIYIHFHDRMKAVRDKIENRLP